MMRPPPADQIDLSGPEGSNETHTDIDVGAAREIEGISNAADGGSHRDSPKVQSETANARCERQRDLLEVGERHRPPILALDACRGHGECVSNVAGSVHL